MGIVPSSSKPRIPNVLASRYASLSMAQLWSPEHKIVLERRLWVAVLKAQKELGVAVPDGVIEDYERVIEQVDLESIAARERVTRHDVKARIEEFSALAGHEHIHKGMTSRDLTENVEQLQIRAGLELVRDRAVATAVQLGQKAADHAALVLTGRSHNVAAQATTLGKRFASAADELLVAIARIEELIERYPLRGIKGPVGTSQDMLDLFDGDSAKLEKLETDIAKHPHKMNTRSCERVNGLAVILRGYASMAGELAGNQWNEGDVFCSVVRRVALPDAFFALDGLFETFLTVLDEFGAYPAVVSRELERYLPFLTTTKVLMAAVKNGVGRETAHEVIKEHAVATALDLRKGLAENDLFRRLGQDGRLGLTEEQIVGIVGEPLSFTGAAVDQVNTVVAKIDELAKRYPEAAAYTPGDIL